MTRPRMPFAIAIFVLGLGMAPSWAGLDPKTVACAKGPWAFQDPASLKGDGEHSLGQVQTPLGTWEARARLSKGDVSELLYLRNGKHAPEVPASKVPQALRACLTQRHAAAPGSTPGPTAWSILESMIPAAQARQTCRPVILSASCYGLEHGTCCALAACGNARAFRCVDF